MVYTDKNKYCSIYKYLPCIISWLFVLVLHVLLIDLNVTSHKSEPILHICPGILFQRVTRQATCGAGSAYPSRAHENTTYCCWGLFYSVFSVVVFCTVVCLFVFFPFSHKVVCLFSICELECPFGIFCLSFSYICGTKKIYINVTIMSGIFKRTLTSIFVGKNEDLMT